MMVDLQPHLQPLPEPSKVYELNFKIQNFKSSNIFQNDLWFLYISRLDSLFASSYKLIFVFEKFDILFTFFCTACPGPAPMMTKKLVIKMLFILKTFDC